MGLLVRMVRYAGERSPGGISSQSYHLSVMGRGVRPPSLVTPVFEEYRVEVDC